MRNPLVRPTQITGELFKENNPLLTNDFVDKLKLLLRFWLTYSQANSYLIEDPDTLVDILRMCAEGNRSAEVAETLKLRGYDVPEEFIDRIYLKLKSLTYLIVKEDYPVIYAKFPEYIPTEEEERVFKIYQTFRGLRGRINNLAGVSELFGELIYYNPHYADFLAFFSTGLNVGEKIQKDGVPIVLSTHYAISENIISALVRGSVKKTLFKEAMSWSVLNSYAHIITSKRFNALLQKSVLIYINGNDSTLMRFTEVRKALEQVITLVDPKTGEYMSSLVRSKKNEFLTNYVSNPETFIQLKDLLLSIIWEYCKYGNLDMFFSRIYASDKGYSTRYIESLFSAMNALIFGCILMTDFTKGDLDDPEIIHWISRNRNTECASILKILAGVEA